MGRLSIRLTIKKLNIYLSKTHSLHSKMTYIAFFLLVGRSLLRFFNSCSPFLLSVGDSFMPLRPSVHLCAFSLWGWIRWTSVSLLWLRRCCSCLSGCFIPLTQRYCSGPEMPVCTGVSVVRNLPMVRPRLSEKFLPSLKHIFFHSCCKNLYLCCSIPQLLLIFCFFFLCPHRISLRIQRLSPHPCVCARVCVFMVNLLIIELFFFLCPCWSFHCYPVCASTSFLFCSCFF